MCRNLEWAQRHGYEFQFHRDAHATNASWAASWERVPLMLDLLRRGRTVLWLDTDLQVIDHQHSWEHVLSSSLLSTEHNVSALLNRRLAAALRGGSSTHHKILPWSVHALQAGCKRGEGEACSKERIALPLAQADRAMYRDNRCA